MVHPGTIETASTTSSPAREMMAGIPAMLTLTSCAQRLNMSEQAAIEFIQKNGGSIGWFDNQILIPADSWQAVVRVHLKRLEEELMVSPSTAATVKHDPPAATERQERQPRQTTAGEGTHRTRKPRKPTVARIKDFKTSNKHEVTMGNFLSAQTQWDEAKKTEVIEAIAALDPQEVTDPDTVAERSMLKILSKFNKIKRPALRRSFINVARKMMGKEASPDTEE